MSVKECTILLYLIDNSRNHAPAGRTLGRREEVATATAIYDKLGPAPVVTPVWVSQMRPD